MTGVRGPGREEAKVLPLPPILRCEELVRKVSAGKECLVYEGGTDTKSGLLKAGAGESATMTFDFGFGTPVASIAVSVVLLPVIALPPSVGLIFKSNLLPTPSSSLPLPPFCVISAVAPTSLSRCCPNRSHPSQTVLALASSTKELSLLYRMRNHGMSVWVVEF